MGLLDRFRRPPQTVHIEGQRLSRDLGWAEEETVQLDRLEWVAVVTTDEGPLVEDVFILLRDSEGGHAAVPQGASVTKELLDRLFELPGFDYEAFLAAMGSTEHGLFECWQRPETAEQALTPS